MVIYGISNCDSTQKAMKFLDKHKLKYTFHNYKVDCITHSKLQEWLKVVDLSVLLNLKSATYRNLNPEEKASLNTKSHALRMMTLHPTLIKRPLLETGNEVLVGYNETAWLELTGSTKTK